MANFIQLVTMLREQMNATMSRSDVLKPLAWLIGMEILGTVLMVFGKAPDWVLQYSLLSLMGTVTVYVVIYVICFFLDRDALRSEKYSLNKMAIEHGLVGDSSTGPIDLDENPKLIDNSVPLKIERDQ